MERARPTRLVDGNTFIDCQREIALGLDRADAERPHRRDRQEQLHLSRTIAGDSAIYVADSPNTQVLHNTILHLAAPTRARSSIGFAHTTGVVIANNLLDGSDRGAGRRDRLGRAATTPRAAAALFVNPAAGDLHLRPTADDPAEQDCDAAAAAATDWDGQSRPAGSTDIGADEVLDCHQSDSTNRTGEPAHHQVGPRTARRAWPPRTATKCSRGAAAE